MSYTIGIDIGTSSTKAAVIACDGQVLGSGQVEYDVETPISGWAEQDPETWWKATVGAIRTALEHSPGIRASEIAGIGLSGQMHGLVLLDGTGGVLRPAIIWPDQRTSEEVKIYWNLIGREALGRLTANPVATGFFGPSLLWVRRNEPLVYKHVRWAVLPKDYIRYRLTGRVGTESTDASSTLLFDTAHRRWSDEILSAFDLDPHLLPDCSEPWEVAGMLSSQASAETGLLSGTPVAYGGGDQPMQALGNGIVTPGVVSVTIGTGGQVFTPVKKAVYDAKLRTHTFCHAVPETWTIMGATLCAGLSLKWLRDHILGGGDYDSLVAAAAEVPPGAEGLFFLPYLVGERTPYFDPEARGAFLGLSLRHTRAHMVKAILEGVVFALRDCLEIFREMGLPIERVVASGGGAQSALWRQIQADVFDCPVELGGVAEQACLGAAIVAAVAVGLYPTVETACASMVAHKISAVQPEATRVARYDALFPLYREAYSTNKEFFHTISKLFHLRGDSIEHEKEGSL